jgi:alpha-L-arabinofuranosidase
LKVVNPHDQEADALIKLPDAEVEPDGQQIVLAGDPESENTPEEPEKVVPVAGQIDDADAEFTHQFKPHSLTILRLKTKAR